MHENFCLVKKLKPASYKYFASCLVTIAIQQPLLYRNHYYGIKLCSEVNMVVQQSFNSIFIQYSPHMQTFSLYKVTGTFSHQTYFCKCLVTDESWKHFQGMDNFNKISLDSCLCVTSGIAEINLQQLCSEGHQLIVKQCLNNSIQRVLLLLCSCLGCYRVRNIKKLYPKNISAVKKGEDKKVQVTERSKDVISL